MTGSKIFGPTKDFPELSQPSGKPMLPRSAGGVQLTGLNFIDLLDTFKSYTGKAGKYIMVRMAEDGLEAGLGSVVGAFTDLSDTFTSYTGLGGKVLVINDTEDGIETASILVIDDGSGNVDLNYHQLENIVINNIAGESTVLVEGGIWYNTLTHTLQYYDGTNVINVSSPDDDFQTLPSTSYSSTLVFPVWDTVTQQYYNLTLADIAGSVNTGFVAFFGDYGTEILPSVNQNISLIGDGLLLHVDTGAGVGAVIDLNDQNVNTFLAGPVSGGGASPTFRNIVDYDMPASYHNAVWDTLLTTPLNTLVPYVGATSTVDLGDQELVTTARITAGTVTIVNAVTDGTDATTKAYVDMYIVLSIFWINPIENIGATLPGGTPPINYKSILTTDNKIYTADGAGNWDTPTSTTVGTTSYIISESKVYTFNGAGWVVISFTIDHNSTTGLQGGAATEYWHLTEDQHTRAITAADDSNDGYLTSTDWIYFDSKADANHTHSAGILDWDPTGTGRPMPYTVKGAGHFDSGTVSPTNVNRLNWDGYLYATELFDAGIRVSTVGHTHSLATNATIGFMPILSDDATEYLDGKGNWTVPAGSGGGSSQWERNAGLGTINPTTHTDKVAIGGDTPGVYMLHVTGNGYYTGSVMVNSDIRTKNIYGRVGCILDEMLHIHPIKFTYKDDEYNTMRFGFSAQEVNTYFPEVAQYDNIDDTYGIDAIGIGAMNTKAIQELLEEIVTLQLECKILRNLIKGNGKATNN